MTTVCDAKLQALRAIKQQVIEAFKQSTHEFDVMAEMQKEIEEYAHRDDGAALRGIQRTLYESIRVDGQNMFVASDSNHINNKTTFCERCGKTAKMFHKICDIAYCSEKCRERHNHKHTNGGCIPKQWNK